MLFYLKIFITKCQILFYKKILNKNYFKIYLKSHYTLFFTEIKCK